MADEIKPMDFTGLNVIHARVIPWTHIKWGVDVEYERGKRSAYAVGSREEAEAEVQRLVARNGQ